MPLDISTIASSLVGTIKPILTKYWGDAAEYAKTESIKMAQTLAHIADLKAGGKIDESQAKALLDMQKQAMQAVLLTVEGIGLVAAQAAINAALLAIKDTVNKVLGFGLL